MAGKRIVSIDFGTRYIHITEGSYKNGTILVNKAYLLDAPTGMYADGKIEDKKSLSDLLHHSLKIQDVKASNVVFTIQCGAVISRDITLPIMKTEDLKSAVVFEMEQYLPALVNGYSLEFCVTNEVVENNTRKYRIRVAAMPEDIVVDYHELAKDLKLKPNALDIHSNAISKLFPDNAIVNGEPIKNKNIALIDYGYKNISISIISNGALDFTRVIGVGGRDLDMVVSSNFDISLEEAELKKMCDIELDQLSKDPNSPELFESHYFDVATQQISEIQKVLQYYANRSRNAAIDKIYLYGGGSNMKGLPAFMKTQLNIQDIAQVKRLANVEFQRNEDGTHLEFCLNAIGAMVRL